MVAGYHGLTAWVWNIVRHYDHNKYWRMRDYLIHNPNKLLSKWYLFRIKRMDAFHNASMGTHIGFKSASFATPPNLPHGLNGIIIAGDVVIGENCTIFHQVTIADRARGGCPIIGDNVLIGAGAKILGPIKIGNNVSIGAGCVVTEDIPDNATVVTSHPRVIVTNVG